MMFKEQKRIYRDLNGVEPWYWDFFWILGTRQSWGFIEAMVGIEDLLFGGSNG